MIRLKESKKLMEVKTTKKELKIGADVYIPSALYVYRGKDDFAGGLCEVIDIELGKSAGALTLFIRVKERPNVWYNWNSLKPKQEELRKQFGNQRGHPDPDLRPEFNDDEADWK